MKRQGPPRHGMTLVELLVVITIMTMLIAVAIPVMRPALKDRKVREASRQLNTYIALAKSKAVETGRPHGIWIVRDPNNRDASYQIFLAETPTPFAGDFLGATATLQGTGGYATSAQITDTQGLVKEGDYIRFNYQGPRYYIATVTAGPPKTLTFTAPNGQPLPKLTSTDTRLPFQVFRQPRRLNSQSLQLPTGTVIDLAYSGVGYSGNEMSGGTSDIALTFQPGGSVDQLIGVNVNIPGTIHFLVGRTENTPGLQTDNSKLNLADGTTSWVSIGHQTGTVTTSENVVADPSTVFASTMSNSLKSARQIAQSKQTMGGR